MAETGNLRSGRVRSCGCLVDDTRRARLTTHGQARTPQYLAWKSMRDRCESPGRRDYPKYGGRGIKLCARWHSYEHFLADMGPRPDGASIDRVNNDGDYEPGNCRWTTAKGQARNRRNNRLDEESARQVRLLRSIGVQAQWLAKTYGVCLETVRLVAKGTIWA